MRDETVVPVGAAAGARIATPHHATPRHGDLVGGGWHVCDMDTSHLALPAVTLLVGLLLGAAFAWLAAGARYGARVAASRAERDALADRVDDLRRADDEDSAAMLALAPLREALGRVERQVGMLERDRVEQYGELGERLAEVGASTAALREQTAGLAGSLNASTVRGTWGETQLRRILEHAGLLERCDFDQQVAGVSAHDARVRPDVVVRLPGRKFLVVDAKAPLSSFLAAQAADLTEAQRSRHRRAHATALRGHVNSLAAKEYWTAFSPSPQLVVCFVPGDAILAAALDADPGLYDDALAAKVVLASPATLMALLRTVAFTWQQDSVTENARELLALGQELYARLGTLGEHVSKMGSQLRRSVESYNAMVGTLESRVFVTARRMHDLDLATTAPEPVPPVDIAPRPLTTVELLDRVDDGPSRRDHQAFDRERLAASAHEAPRVDSA